MTEKLIHRAAIALSVDIPETVVREELAASLVSEGRSEQEAAELVFFAVTAGKILNK